MYDGSQIQDKMWEDASDIRDSEEKIRNSMKPISYEMRISRMCKEYNNGNKSLKNLMSFYLEDRKILSCSICDYYSKSLSRHVISHGISIEDYKKIYGQVVSDKKIQSSIENGKWVSRNIQKGIDMTEYLREGAKSLIRESRSESGRKRRSDLLTKLNQNTDFQKIRNETASKTAIKTSQRPEILKERSERLKNWRDKNPDVFFKLIRNNFLKSWSSVPESILFEYCKKEFSDNFFKRNQQLKSKKYFTSGKTNRRQIDIFDKKSKIAIEYDGQLHFKNTKLNSVDLYKIKDEELNNGLINMGYFLIRVSYDNFKYKGNKNGFFSEECLNKIREIVENINNNTLTDPAVFKIGSVYGESN